MPTNSLWHPGPQGQHSGCVCGHWVFRQSRPPHCSTSTGTSTSSGPTFARSRTPSPDIPRCYQSTCLPGVVLIAFVPDSISGSKFGLFILRFYNSILHCVTKAFKSPVRRVGCPSTRSHISCLFVMTTSRLRDQTRCTPTCASP
jgi:hypothetical protein